MSFLSTYPLPPSFMCSMNFFKLTHQIQVVLPLYSRVWGHPLKYG